MKPFALIAAAAVLIAAPAVHAKTATLEVQRAWSRPAVAGTTGIGYMVVVNHGRAADALEKVETPIASRVEMHSSTMSGGVMSMEKQDKVAVPANGETTFGPGAYHLMLIGLTKTLKPGDEAPATLTFASGAKLRVKFVVSSGMGPPTAIDHR
ncbi:MAG: copper chaperone PCu(A)C [Proteobacteria bacterium]|nr:copper chaperone PCu(A)C [Pseudomonadota bacterium]